LQSYDGIHWTNVYQTPVQIAGAAYGNNQFVFVGSHIISAMLKPLQWTEFAPGIALGGVTYGAGQFVAISSGAILSTIILNSASVTGMTARRGWRISAIAAKRESALIVSKDTGRASVFTGAKSQVSH